MINILPSLIGQVTRVEIAKTDRQLAYGGTIPANLTPVRYAAARFQVVKSVAHS